jgi:ubiquinone/menaquinone biosynthesis C-methylase UbiE
VSNSQKSWWWQIVDFGFRLLYHEMAFTYDAISWIVSLGQWRCWQRSVFSYLPEAESGLVLEIAHGTGNLQLDLQTAHYQTIAYDFSAQMGQIAKSKVPATPFIRGMAQKLPFRDASFAAIVCTFPTSFIVDANTLREAYRVLHADGLMIVVLNGMLTGGGIVEQFLEWLYTITGQREGQHYSMEKAFAAYGFQLELLEVPCKNSVAQLVILRK